MKQLQTSIVSVSSMAGLLAVALAACESSSNADAPPTTSTTDGVHVVLTPAQGNLLTCGNVKAEVTGVANQSVTWSTDPATSVASDASGAYLAPIRTPSPASFTLTATSVADPTAKGSGAFTLATAFPGPAITVSGSSSNGESYGVFPHWMAARGTRAYAVWPTATGTAAKLMLGRSDDGGATWKPATAAVSTTLVSDNDAMDCAAVAIDAANPDIVYALVRISGSNDLSTSVGGTGETLVLGVSTDGGTTFTPRVLQVGGTAGGPLGWDLVGICGDVASPAPNTVVVESPGFYSGDHAPDMALWSDASHGDGFAAGTLGSGDYVANSYSTALANVNGATNPEGRLGIAQNGGTNDAGGATESPRLFTDGAGHLCLTYLGTLEGTTTETNTYVQCSSNGAKTFSSPLKLDPNDGAKHHSQPVGALTADGHAAVVWTTGIADGGLFVATSTDGGATFSAPQAIPTYVVPDQSQGASVTNPAIAYDASGILWLAYAPSDGGSRSRIVVDKSCDGGTTWSGAVLVNGPESNIENMQWPALAISSGAAPFVLTHAADHLAVYPLFTP